MPVRPVRGAVAVLAGLLAVGACSSPAHEAKPLAPLTPSASPSSPSATPTPAERRPTAAGAAAFVRAYYAAANADSIKGTDTGFTAYFLDSCSVCKESHDYLKYLKRRKIRNNAAPLEIINVSPYRPTGTVTTVTVRLRSGKGAEVGSTGHVVRRFSADPAFSESVALLWRKSRWVITDITEFR